nr:vicilin-like seed storage protein At2g18540 [Aedes albopictus]
MGDGDGLVQLVVCQRLEEEKKLLEDLSREKAEKERALYERELQEKLERERQYIARKHELLNQQDGGEAGHGSRELRITIGDESEESLEDAVGADKDERDKLPLVNLQPYEDLLQVAEAVPVGMSTGVIPKNHRFGTLYKRWSAETGEVRKPNSLQLQRQLEAERRTIQNMQKKHREDIDTWHRREVDLVNRLTSLQRQHDAELKLVCNSEANLRKQQDRERVDLESRIGTLEEQLIMEKERKRTSEVDLRNQLEQRKRECEALRLQVTELESELQCLRGVEQQLQSHIIRSRQREHEAIRVRNEAEKQYWDLHEGSTDHQSKRESVC